MPLRTERGRLKPDQGSSELSFVVFNGPKQEEDAHRSITMRNAAATRKKRETIRKNKPSSNTDTSLAISAPLVSSKYEIARLNFVADITALSILTNFNISKAAVSSLARRPNLLLKLLSQGRRFSYLFYVPQYYGHSECLTAATDSVLGKLDSLLKPSTAATENDLYRHGYALTSLQQALDDPQRCNDVDVLCAAQLLGIRELTERSKTRVWDNHMQGAIILAKHRTPASYNTDFERALLVAQAGPVVFESLVTNKPCFLAEPEWTAVYRSTVKETPYLTDRSSLTVNLRCLVFRIPGSWQSVDEVITSDQLFNDHALRLAETETRLVHDSLLAWHRGFSQHCESKLIDNASPDAYDMQFELKSIYLECLAITKRLLAVVCDVERTGLEQDAQSLAQQIMSRQKDVEPHYSWLFCGHEVGLARTIQITSPEWIVDARYDSDYDRRMAVRARYTNWNRHARSGIF